MITTTSSRSADEKNTFDFAVEDYKSTELDVFDCLSAVIKLRSLWQQGMKIRSTI